MLLLILLVIAATVGWYLFRPERLFVNAKVHETLPQASEGTASSVTESAARLLSGSFHSVAHTSSGNAAIYKLAEGSRVLRFTDFETSNGPDVRVYLVASSDATDSMVCLSNSTSTLIARHRITLEGYSKEKMMKTTFLKVAATDGSHLVTCCGSTVTSS